VNYHKTGEFFLNDLQDVLPPLFGATFAGEFVNREVQYFGSSFHDTSAHRGYKSNAISELSTGEWARVKAPAVDWPLPNDARTLYFFRDPVDLLISAYRYHSDEIMHETPWQTVTTRCHNCDANASNVLFELCDFTCTYVDLLHDLGELGGVVVEAYQSRRQLEYMVGNFIRWANNPNVLFLSMEHLGEDYNATMKCMLDFLSFSGDDQKAMDELVKLDIHGKGTDTDNMDHVTEGKYENDQIQAKLENHTTWIPQLKKIRNNLLSVYNRQADLYGCPVPDLLSAAE
jgi:hypothetical protein